MREIKGSNCKKLHPCHNLNLFQKFRFKKLFTLSYYLNQFMHVKRLDLVLSILDRFMYNV